MKHLFLLLFLGLNLSNVAFAQGNAEMSFAEEKFNFGELDEGPKVNHEFMFTNTGTEALVLSNV
jgi:hypothetical protein